MTKNDKQPKPDDRSDNYEKLQEMTGDTAENIDKSQETMENLSGEDRQELKAKNKRRKEAMKSFQQEMEDESENQYK